MKQYLTVIKNDLKLMFRDETMFLIFFIPIILVFVCRFGVPYLTEWVKELPGYYWLIVAGFTSITASTPSFLVGFIILDEKDQNVDIIKKILPLPPNFVLKCRIIFMVVASFIFSLFILSFNGLITFSIFYTISISMLFSLIPPVLTFAIIGIAKNKIEAATLYKGLSMVLFLPIAAFFIHNEWRFAFGIIPFYWTFNAFKVVNDIWYFLLNFVAGITVHTLFILLLYNMYKRKI